VVSLGSIGRRHLANLRRVDPAIHCMVLRRAPGEDDAGIGADELFFDLDAAVAAQPDAAIVAGPSPLHVPVAMALAAAGVHLLIEKPISNVTDGVEALIRRCNENSLVLMVGYNLRFHRPLQLLREAVAAGTIGEVRYIRAEVGQYLPEWRPAADYRQSVTARAEMGGGVLLELSHEFDYVRWIAGEAVEVTARIERLGGFENDVEDLAEVVLRLENGGVASVHLDMLQRVPFRGCRVIGSEGTVKWTGGSNEVRRYTAATREWEVLHPAGPIDFNACYVDELRHFLDCVSAGSAPSISGEDALKTLHVVDAARTAAATGRAVSL
jgi:predicted dehydrogenase